MPKGEILHELISSLDRTEKAYFKKFALKGARNGQSEYLRLFDCIEQKGGWDEKFIRKKFNKSKICNQMPAARHHLYQLILKSLEDYNRNKDIHSRIRHLLEQAEILRRKRLREQSLNLVKKAKEIAQRHQAMTHYFDILRVELQLKLKQDPAFLEVQMAEEEAYLKMYRNRSQIRILYYSIFREFRRYTRIRDPKQLTKIKELMKDPLLADESNALSFQAKNNFHSLYANFYALTAESTLQFKARQNQLELWKSHPQRLEDQPITYIRVVYNYAESALKLKAYEQVEAAIKLLESIKTRTSEQRAEVDETLWYMRLKTALLKQEFEYGNRLVDNLQLELDKGTIKFKRDMEYGIKALAAITLFYAGELQRSLQLQVELIQKSDYTYQEDIQASVRLLNLVTHFELGNQNMMERVFKSTYRYLLRRKQLHEFERLTIKAMRKTASMPNDRRLREEAFLQFHQNLNKLKATLPEGDTAQHFDISIWLEGKINTPKLKSGGKNLNNELTQAS